MLKRSDCNYCGKTYCKVFVRERNDCKNYQPIRSTIPCVELALNHPQSLHDALNALPFKVELALYLRNGKTEVIKNAANG